MNKHASTALIMVVMACVFAAGSLVRRYTDDTDVRALKQQIIDAECRLADMQGELYRIEGQIKQLQTANHQLSEEVYGADAVREGMGR